MTLINAKITCKTGIPQKIYKIICIIFYFFLQGVHVLARLLWLANKLGLMLFRNHVVCVSSLCVQGRKAVLSRPSEDVDHPPGTPSGSRGHDRPRVIEAEGLMEEYLAFDCSDLWVTSRLSCLVPSSISIGAFQTLYSMVQLIELVAYFWDYPKGTK